MSSRIWPLSSVAPLGALALAFAFCIATPARGGGPLDLVNHQPVVYANGGSNLKLNVDQGPLGTRTNSQAVALVQNAIGLWNGVQTSTMRLSLGATLATDYNRSNYSGIFNNFSDGLNPVIFDTDGSITDAIFGVGAKSSILGFAGSAYYTSGASAGKFAEGRAVLNGSINVSDGLWTIVLAHEFGHFFGLDHSQIDSAQGMAQSNYVLMYPIAYRTLVSLHEDDAAAVTALYPSASAASVYGQLTGNFTTTAGAPILGANIWAKENSTGKAYSVVSDFLTQGNGYFRLLLPAGTYTLHAESIDSGFTGGSGVGPYASSSSDVSFQPPHPITPVALGGASPQQIVITAGCVATATFRLNGAGSVGGNCASAPSSQTATTTTLASSANPTAVGALVTFTATVAGSAPTGTVSFKDSGTAIAGCGAVALAGAGTAACSTSALVAGVHSIVAAYSGDPANASSSAALSQVVNAAAQTNVLASGVPVTGLSGTTNTELRYTMTVPAGATNLIFRTTGGSGNANLFVKFGSPPTTTAYDCRSTSPGTAESCGFLFPRTGTYHVLVRGASAFAGVTLTATFK
jgi:hypothetical protein